MAIDAVVGYHVETGARIGGFFPRDNARLRSQLALAPQDLDRAADHRRRFLDSAHSRHDAHLHLNAVSLWAGRRFALFNAKGAIADITHATVVYRDPALVGAHDLVIREDGLTFINDTRRAMLRIIDLAQGRLVKSISLRRLDAVQWLVARTLVRSIPKLGRSLVVRGQSHLARPLFLWGLAVSGSRAWLGLAPATIVCIDWEAGRLIDLYQYSEDVRVCVHGLALSE